MRATIGPLMALCLTVAAQAAWAQTTEDHFKAGARAFDDGDFPLAVTELEAFTAANATNAKAWLLLGNAYAKVGRFDDARKAFESYLKHEPNAAKARKVKGLIADLGVLATTKFHITTTPPGATVYLDLKAAGPQGKTPLTLSVKPGQYRIILELEGYEPANVDDAIVASGQEVPIELALRIKGCDLTFAVEPKAVGTSVMIDGAQGVPTTKTVRVGPGEHRLVIAGKDLVSRTETIQCAAEKPVRVEAALEAVPPPPPPKPVVVAPPPPPKPKPVVDPHAGRTQRVAGLVVGAVGVAMIGGGAALGWFGLQARDRFSNPNDGDIFNPDVESRARLWLPLGVGLGVAGVAALVGGVVLYQRGVKARREAQAAAQVTLVPLLAPGRAGALATWSF